MLAATTTPSAHAATVRGDGRPWPGWDAAPAATLGALLDWVNHASDPMVALDEAGRVRHANPAFARAFGAAPDGDPAPALSERVPLLTAPRLARWIGEAAPAGAAARVHRLLVEGVAADGERFLLAATLLRAARGADPAAPCCVVALRPLDAPHGAAPCIGTPAARDAVRLDALVDAALRSLPAAERRRRIERSLHAPQALVPVDPDAVRHALLALLSNAARHSPPEAPIAVRSRVEACDGADWIVVRVADRGVGMTRAQRSRAFEPFPGERGGDASAGSGVGLAVARRLVESVGGWIELSSALGVGTEVEVWLPVA